MGSGSAIVAGNLTYGRLAELASGPGVRRIAVENFLGSISGSGMAEWEHLVNLAADARVYGWNAATVKAIRVGLALIYRRRSERR